MNQSWANKNSSDDCPYATRNNNKRLRSQLILKILLSQVKSERLLKRARPLQIYIFFQKNIHKLAHNFQNDNKNL